MRSGPRSRNRSGCAPPPLTSALNRHHHWLSQEGRALTIANIHGRPCSPLSGSPALRQRPPISEFTPSTPGVRRKSGSQLTQRWSKPDSNRWSPSEIGAARAVRMTRYPCRTFRNGRIPAGRCAGDPEKRWASDSQMDCPDRGKSGSQYTGSGIPISAIGLMTAVNCRSPQGIGRGVSITPLRLRKRRSNAAAPPAGFPLAQER
jgi:hypothetical protein